MRAMALASRGATEMTVSLEERSRLPSSTGMVSVTASSAIGESSIRSTALLERTGWVQHFGQPTSAGHTPDVRRDHDRVVVAQAALGEVGAQKRTGRKVVEGDV